MKYLRFLVLFLSATMVFTACQKELSLELGLATGSLKSDTNGDCLPVLINGTYQKDTLLNATNYVDVQVNIVNTGAYVIKTDTINGYSFSASGSVAVAGLNTIRLLGSGRPVAPSLDVFTVKFDTSSCQINVIVTGTGGGGGTSAVFTLDGSPAACTGATLAGTYAASTATNASNTATISVNVTQIGTYNISTGAAVNGVVFSGSGSFTSTGPTTVVLTASGTPTASGSFNYPLASGASNCSFSVTYASAPAAAVFTLDGSPTTCTGATLAGTYAASTATNTSNTATINVNVTQIGTYNISTGAAVNGVVFTGSGSFTTTGPTTVVLTASGVPTASGSFNYPIASGASNCSFSVTYTGAPTDFITCTINGVPTSFNDLAEAVYDNTTIPGYNFLAISGENSTTADIGFAVGRALTQSGGAITTGTYTVNQAPNTIVIGSYNDASGNGFQVFSDVTPQTPAFTITITAISATRVSGTFSGPLKDNGGAGPGVRNITNGSFSVPIN